MSARMDRTREALIEHSGVSPSIREMCGECGRGMDSPHTPGCHVPAALAEVEEWEDRRRALEESEERNWNRTQYWENLYVESTSVKARLALLAERDTLKAALEQIVQGDADHQSYAMLMNIVRAALKDTP